MGVNPLRIAVAGTHFSGKTTIAEALVERLSDYVLVEEPYHQMIGEGYAFSEVPSVDEFYEQLIVSVASIRASGKDTLFDRSPFDFIAYALSLRDRDDVDVQEWIEKAKSGVDYLDAIAFCGIEEPDRITLPLSEDRRLRLAVDEKLRAFILDDDLGILGDVAAIEVKGSVDQRLAQIAAELPGLAVEW